MARESAPGTTAGHRRDHIFLINRPNRESRAESVRYLRDLGVKVLAVDGDNAIVGAATSRHVESAASSGLFGLITSQPIGRETLEGLEKESPHHIAVARRWNYRWSPAYLKAKKRQANRGVSWGSADHTPHTPTPLREPDDVIEFVTQHLDAKDPKEILDRYQGKDGRLGKMAPPGKRSREDLDRLRELFLERVKDENVAYQVALMAYFLPVVWIEVLLVIEVIILIALAEVECWKMENEIAVAVVFVESSKSGGPKFSSSDRSKLETEVVAGLNWLAAEAPTAAQLTWVYEWQYISIDVADGSADQYEDYWRNPAMGEITFNGNSYSEDWDGFADFREDLRVHHQSAHAMVIFVTPFECHAFAYASPSRKRITLTSNDGYGGWGINTVDSITVHEACHLFGAADEYTGTGTPCSDCGTLHGCYELPNGNCKACADPGMDCVMDANDLRLCPYTQGHIGWADVFVELETADANFAGTDDSVRLDLGDRTFNLDNPNYDDRERGSTEGYALNYTGMAADEVKRVGIRKGEDGWLGGWKMRRLKVWHQGTVVCERTPNTWIEDDDLWWSCPGAGSSSTIVNTLRVKVTTANVSWAGTDDSVTLFMGGRSWDLDNAGHNDFERGNTDTFDLDPGVGLYENMLSSLQIHKSPDGWFGGWKLKGLEIIVNGSSIYNNQSINKWLEDNDRDWFGTV